jgi:hypothetical protein
LKSDPGEEVDMIANTAIKYVSAFLLFDFLLLAFQAKVATPDKKPVDYANALVGTAPLDNPKLIGNAPPPGGNFIPASLRRARCSPTVPQMSAQSTKTSTLLIPPELTIHTFTRIAP